MLLCTEFGDGFNVTLFRKVSSAPEKVSSAPEKVSSAPEKVSSAPEKVSSTFDKYIPLLKAVDVTDIFINNISVRKDLTDDRCRAERGCKTICKQMAR